MKVRFHEEAKREFYEAIRFYRMIDSVVADTFVRKVEDALHVVSVQPLTFPLTSGGKRRYLLKRFPFGIYLYH